MRIIIDGCDKSGKSTLIEGLKNQIPSLIGLKLLTKPYDKSDASKQYVKQMYMHMAEMTRNQSAHYLFDRWYPSEMVYSFKRGYDAMEDPWFWTLEKELRKTPNLYILLDVDTKILEKRFDDDDEKFAKKKEINHIKNRYKEHFKNCQLNKLMIDPTDNLEDAIAKIKKTVEEILEVKTHDFTGGK